MLFNGTLQFSSISRISTAHLHYTADNFFNLPEGYFCWVEALQGKINLPNGGENCATSVGITGYLA